ncbi:chemotaxis protein CheW [Desulfonema magnum]|uniref:CheW-like domain-containing protein n=1 Tax=Desulfonema magnum TaxID=45655 RepID=A0A975BJF2_9BACT|nr:chemotaxis protein CheW [Desulfonema magnum]QTA86809.1 CheW-like domain-containing protein [Desulfonema magnum]
MVKKDIQDRTAIPLEDLIAEIDMKTDQAAEKSEPASGSSVPVYAKQYLRFFLNDIMLAFPLSGALEIIGHQPDISPLPNLPDWVLGVSNIRGEIISVVDLKAFFRLSQHQSETSKRVIIVHNQNMKAGIIVDRIMGIFSVNQKDMDNARNSPYEKGEISSYISDVIVLTEKNEDILLNIFDIDKFLSSDRMTAFRTE